MNIYQYLAKIKTYFVRTSLYVSILNFGMIISTVKIQYGIDISLFLIIPLSFVFVLFIGYVDYKLIMRPEFEFNNKQNDMKNDLDDLKISIDRLVASMEDE